jgi:phosphoribosyl-dephospho-CoA transferase
MSLYNGNTPVKRYYRPDEMTPEEQVVYYKTRCDKLTHANKELRGMLTHEKYKHTETNKQLERVAGNMMTLTLNLTQEVSNNAKLRNKFNWWQKIINRYI